MKVSKYTKKVLLLGVILTIIISVQSGIAQGLPSSTPSDLSRGPFIDEAVYRVIANQDQRIAALLAGDIVMDTSFFDPVHIDTLTGDPDISIFQSVRNGYGHLTINCDKYPLNLTGLRRAFAYAYNKTRVVQDTFDGFAIEHDSLVPLPNSWCIEDDLPCYYYDAQPEIGNQILDDLNFTIDPGTGFRLAPNGTSFHIVIEYAAPGGLYPNPTRIAVEAFNSLNISSESRASDYNEYMDRLYTHEDYDIVFYATNFDNNDVDWLAYEYWSEYANTPYQNPTNFRNTTYDFWRNQLLNGSTYEEVYEAASEMQKILQYNVPRLVVYENSYLQSYRNNQFTGYVEDLLDYISGPWTMRKIHKLDGTIGGTVNVAISDEPDSFNFFVTTSPYSKIIMKNLWPSLYKFGPDANPWPDIAETMLTETHSDNPAVPENHTRFTIDIVQNASWSDSEPLTAEDVVFTFTYLQESAKYNNSVGLELESMITAYAASSSRVIVEFNTESYWHFSKFAYQYIIPEHIFNNDTGIGYEWWNKWNPVYDPFDPHFTCGPFVLTDYEAGESYTLSYNPLFHYYDPSWRYTPPPPDHIATTSETTNQSTGFVIPLPLVLNISIASGSAIVIFYCIVKIIQKRQQ